MSTREGTGHGYGVGEGRSIAIKVVLAYGGFCIALSVLEGWLIMPWRAINPMVADAIHDSLFAFASGILVWQMCLRNTARLERVRAELREAEFDTIHRLSHAADLIDDTRAGHNRRVGQYSREIARNMGFHDRFCDDISRTAMLHDIGEIAVPEFIRLKAHPHDVFERLRMMGHVEIGGDLLRSDRRMLAMAANIARHHHECFDGSGYPDGISGKKIPVEARIVAVADVFDALTSDRPHRRAYGIDFAFDEIQALSGTQFDPDVVQAFMEAKPEILHYLQPSPLRVSSLNPAVSLVE